MRPMQQYLKHFRHKLLVGYEWRFAFKTGGIQIRNNENDMTVIGISSRYSIEVQNNKGFEKMQIKKRG